MTHAVGQNGNYPVLFPEVPVQEYISAYPFTVVIFLLAVYLYVEILAQCL
jgi:hypothetical protein